MTFVYWRWRQYEVTKRKSWAPSFPSEQIGWGDVKMANVVNPASATTLDECEALLEEVVTELNLSALNS